MLFTCNSKILVKLSGAVINLGGKHNAEYLAHTFLRLLRYVGLMRFDLMILLLCSCYKLGRYAPRIFCFDNSKCLLTKYFYISEPTPSLLLTFELALSLV